ncbi:MAG: hypothetical protein WAV11_00365 [Minisyncoccia bacterium]
MYRMGIVESGWKDGSVGDKKLKEKAYGALQIRQPALTDVNKKLGTKYTSLDCINSREVSITVAIEYTSKYATESHLGRKPTQRDMVLIYNGGPCAAFENGAIDKLGHLPKDPKMAARVKLCQRNARIYAQKVFSVPLSSERMEREVLCYVGIEKFGRPKS